jgi:catechol 2,3-dioxygenase
MTDPQRRLGHVVLRVRSLAVSVPFYTQVLGLREVARLDGPERDIVGGELAFLSFGSNHHDVALLESPQVRPTGPADPQYAGLAHVALRIGDSIETLRAFHAHLRDQGVALAHSRDHEVSQSLYLRDPDGLLIEVYVDADPALWAARPEAVATVRPLRVDWLD